MSLMLSLDLFISFTLSLICFITMDYLMFPPRKVFHSLKQGKDNEKKIENDK